MVGLPILVGITAGLFVGLVNGLIVAKLHVPPFIATLGTMVAVYALIIDFDTKQLATSHSRSRIATGLHCHWLWIH